MQNANVRACIVWLAAHAVSGYVNIQNSINDSTAKLCGIACAFPHSKFEFRFARACIAIQ
jgi:hypothetical protein